MDKLFFGGAGGQANKNGDLPGQPERNSLKKKWEIFMQEENGTHEYQILFIKDRVENGEVAIEFCPTKEMVADLFTKPLQGQVFWKFRSMIMNINPAIPDCDMACKDFTTLKYMKPQECVGGIAVPHGGSICASGQQMAAAASPVGDQVLTK